MEKGPFSRKTDLKWTYLAKKVHKWTQVLKSLSFNQGIARTQSPTNKNYAFELPTFGVIVEVNPTVVQWKGLTLEEPPS